ncbi:MAG: hypothetical protein K6E93_00815 [Bacteroidales bacterium]|nr:hypothetical protein [Bacteroidales bacterium]
MKKRLYFVASILLFVSCGTAQKANDNSNDPTTWQGVMRMWCEEYEIDDAQRLAIVDQIISVFDMIDDTTISAEQLEEPICKMKESIEHVIDTDGFFEFVQMMRATARNIAGRMANDSRLLSDCAFELTLIDGIWQTSSDDSLDFMATSLFYNSWQAFARKTNIILTKSDLRSDADAVMIFTNFIDTTMDNLNVFFLNDNKDTVLVITEKDMLVDNSDAYAGVKRAFVSPSLLIDAIFVSQIITVSYDTPNEHVEYISFPPEFFLEQVKNCPRLKKIVDKMMDDIEIRK